MPNGVLAILFCLYLSRGQAQDNCVPEHQAPCPDGWVVTSNPRTCIRHNLDRLTWSQARDVCCNDKGELVTPLDQLTAMAITDLVNKQKPADLVWLALQEDPNSTGTWIWPDGSVALFSNWKPSHRPGKSIWTGKCVSLDTRNGQWQRVGCKTEQRYMCQTSTEDMQCPSPYQAVDPISLNTCVMESTELVDYNNVSIKCDEVKGDPLSIKTTRVHNAIMDFMESRGWAWMGLHRVDGKKFRWVYDKRYTQTKYLNWAPRYPKRKGGQDCVYTDGEGVWYHDVCERKLSSVCQIKSPVGPSEPRMKFRYHRSPNSMYLGEPLYVTCEASGTESGTFTWTANKKRTEINLHSHFASVENTRMARRDLDGKCRVTTVSILRMERVSMDLHEAFISCYPYTPDPKSVCVKGAFTMCKKSRQLQVIEGPQGRPTFLWNFHHKTNEILAGEPFKGNCTVFPGKARILQWIVHYPTLSEVIPRGDIRIKQWLETKDKRNRTVIMSSIEFPMNKSVAGVYVTCYSYDAIKYSRDGICEDSDLYCATTPPLSTSPADKRVKKNYLLLRLALFILSLPFILAFVYILLRPRRHPTVAQEDQQAPAGPPQVSTESKEGDGTSPRHSSGKSQRSSEGSNKTSRVDPDYISLKSYKLSN